MSFPNSWKVLGLLGSHFLWILALPLWGPVLGRLGMEAGHDPFSVGIFFAVASAGGFLLLGRGQFSHRSIEEGALGASILIAVISGLFFIAPPGYWRVLALMAGLSSSLIIVFWFLLFTQNIERQRWLLVGIVVAVTNAMLLLTGIAVPYTAKPVLAVMNMVLAGITSLLTWDLGQSAPAGELVPTADKSLRPDRFFIWLAGAIFLLYFAGSFVVDLVYLGLAVDLGYWGLFLNTIPYIGGILLLAFYLEKQIFLFPIGACVLFGMSMVIRLIVENQAVSLTVATILVMSAFAVLDLFLWGFLTTLPNSQTSGGLKSFSWGLAANLLAVALGSWITWRFQFPRIMIGAAAILLFATFIPLTILLAMKLRTESDADRHDAPYAETLDFSSFGLTNRENDVMELLIQGLSNEDIAERLFISVATVRTHLRNIYRKTGCANRRELLAEVIKGDAHHL